MWGRPRATPSQVTSRSGHGLTRSAASRWAARRGGDFEASRFERDRQAGRRWSVGGAVLGVALGALLGAPASWLADGLASASQGRLLLAEAQGSLWSGSAVAVLTGGSGSRDASALPGRLHWTLQPRWRHWLPHLAVGLRQDCCLTNTVWLNLRPTWGGFTADLGEGGEAAAPAAPPQAIGQWPAAWLSGLGAPFNTLALGGTLQLASPGFTVQQVAGRLRMVGGLNFELRNAASGLSPLPVLGDYRLQVQGVPGGGESALLALSTPRGALQLNANGQWAGGRLRLRGEAAAAPGQETALSNLLSLIGRRNGARAVISIG